MRDESTASFRMNGLISIRGFSMLEPIPCSFPKVVAASVSGDNNFVISNSGSSGSGSKLKCPFVFTNSPGERSASNA